jgi:seryl-tRNA synthetase
LGFDKKRQELLLRVEDLRRQRNELAEKGKNNRPSEEDIARGRDLKDQLGDVEHQLASIDEELTQLLRKVPNMPLDNVPLGASEDENVVAREWGEKPQFDYEPRSHWQIAEERGIDRQRTRGKGCRQPLCIHKR